MYLIQTFLRDRLLLGDLNPETTYSLKLRAVNADGASSWTEFTAKTKSDPLEWAIKGITAETTCANQGGEGVNLMFDFDESNLWHTAWSKKAVPFDLVMDLNSIGQVEKFIYLPRQNGGNGTLLNGTIAYSMDKKNWSEAGSFEWKGGDAKEFQFKEKPVMRYIKIYNAGETIEIKVKGTGMHGVNALSFALPYNPQEMEYLNTEAKA